VRFVLLAVTLLGCSYQAPDPSAAADDAPQPDASEPGTDATPEPDAPPDTIAPICAGYTPAGSANSNYLVVTTPATWPAAEQACAATSNGHLVVIGDATENALVRGMIADPTRFWMGFSDLATENTWKWLDNTDVLRTDALWDPGQPNDNQTFGGEDCGEMSGGGLWNDKNCDTNAQPYICECP
jgi:hypothetical protein